MRRGRTDRPAQQSRPPRWAGGRITPTLADAGGVAGCGATDAAAEAEYWQHGRFVAWLPGGAGTSRSTSNWSLVKTPITLDRLAVLDEMLAAHGAARRYSGGGNLAWIGWPRDLGDLDRRAADFSLGGLVVLGNTDAPLIGVPGRIWPSASRPR